MSLYQLCYAGLLTDECNIILKSLRNNFDWNIAEENLFESGFISSKNRANVLRRIIQKRLTSFHENLPKIEDLLLISNSNFQSSVKAEIFFVYLYYSDLSISSIVDAIGNIFDHNRENPIIHRKDIKQLLLNYQKSLGKEAKEKTITNWIGRFISILKEVNILIPQKNHEYFINFGDLQDKTWYFFLLHSFFKEYNLEKASFLRAYQITNDLMQDICKRMNNQNFTYTINKKDNKTIIKLKTKYKNIEEWIIDLK